MAAVLIFLGFCAAASAAVPGALSYQGTLRNNGALVTATVAMEFRITSADGLTQYWTSDSTNVAVSAGLFRYTLGTPNAAQFAAIPWKDITPYVQMLVEGNPFPREPLFASAYALHAYTAEGSTGTFTAYDGDIRISTSAGSKGLVFQDGTAQYSAAGWSVSGQNTLLSGSGNAGLGVAAPQARLDVQAASPSASAQIWRDSAGVVKASVSASGFIFAPGLDVNDTDANTTSSGVRFANFACSGTAKLTVDSSGNLVCASDQTGSGTGNLVDPLFETLDAGNNAGGLGVVNLGSVAMGLGTAGSRLDVQGASGGYSQIWRNASGVEVASLTTSGLLYADAANLRNLPSGADNLGSHVATANLNMGAFNIVNAGGITAAGQVTSYSSVTVAGELGTPRLGLSAGVAVSSTPETAAIRAGVYVSSNIYVTGVSSAAAYYGAGTALTGLNASNINSGTLADSQLSANIPKLDAANTFSGSLAVSATEGASAPRLGLAAGVEISSTPETAAIRAGVYVSSNIYVTGVSSAAAYYGAGTALTGLNASNINSGTLSDSQLSANIPKLNAANIFSGSLAVSAAEGASAPRLSLAAGVDISSTPAAFHGGVGVQVSSNVFIVGIASATRYYGDGSALTGFSGSDNLGNHIATKELNMSGFRVDNVGDITSAGRLTVYSSATVGGALGLGSPKLALAPGIEISSTSADFYGGVGVQVSSNVFVVGIASAARYYGDGSFLTGIVGSDSLGSHIAAQDLNMAGFAVVGVSSITVSSLTSAGVGVIFTTHVLVMNGSLGVDTETPQEKLHVQGSILSSALVGASNRCVYVDPAGVLRSKLSDCGSASGGDEMGAHIMTQTLTANGNWISGDGGNEGISLNSDGSVGVGIFVPSARLDVQAADANAQFWRNAGGTVVSSMSAAGVIYAEASGLRGLTLASTLEDGNSAAGIGVTDLGDVAIGLSAANARLDVQAVDANAQFWRNNLGVVMSSMSASGVIYAEASGLRGLPVDGLGSHTATQALNMDGNRIDNAGDITSAGKLTAYSSVTVASGLGLGSPKLALLDNVEISSTSEDFHGGVGVQVSSNVFIVGIASATRYYGDGSALTGITTADTLGTHLATQALNMAGNRIDNAGDITSGGKITAYSSVTVASELGLGSPKLALLDNVEISSTSEDFHGGVGVQVSSNVFIVGIASATKFYGDGSALTGVSGSVTGMANPATADLDMNGNSVYGVASLAATNSSLTNIQAGQIGTTQPQLTISTNLYVAGHSAFGNGIAAPSTFSAVSIFESYAGEVRDNIGLNVLSELAPPADDMWATTTGGTFGASMPDNNARNSALLRGIYAFAQARNGGNLLYASGVMGGVTKTNDGVLSEAFGGYFSVNTGFAATAGNIINAYGVYTRNYAGYSLTPITNVYGVFVDSAPVGANAYVTNNYGVYIADQQESGDTKSFNLYSAGALSKNYLQGKTGIAVEPSAAVTAPLQLEVNVTDGSFMHMSNGGAWCDLRISLGTTCPAGTKLGEHNTKSLCLVCS